MKEKIAFILFFSFLLLLLPVSATAAGPFSFERSLSRASPGGADEMGGAMAFSSDGSRLLVGMQNGGKGAAVVFRHDIGGWTEEATLEDVLSSAEASLGFSDIALSSDGSVAVLGGLGQDAPGGLGGEGYAVVFTRSGNTWSKAQTIYRASPGFLDSFGGSLALSADGSTLAIGAPGASTDGGSKNGAGVVEIYRRDAESGLFAHSQTVVASDRASGDNFGSDIDISSDGSRLAVGVYADGGGKGSVRIYDKGGTSFEETAALQRADGANDNLGYPVSLSNSGNVVAAGASSDNVASHAQQGSVSVYRYSSGSWGSESRIVDSAGAASDSFPYEMDLSGDGRTIVGTLPYSSTGTASLNGRALLFHYSSSIWIQGATLDDKSGYGSDPTGASNDYLGSGAVFSADNSLLALGASGTQSSSFDTVGRAVLYTAVPSYPSAPSLLDTPASISGTDVSFSFASDGTETGFTCQMDSATPEDCQSAKEYTSLASGSHTFSVVARGSGADSSASTYTWTVDGTAPAAPAIDSAPSVISNDTSPSFAFHGDGEAGTTFLCSIDGEARGECQSPKTYAALQEGLHTFSVAAEDTRSNVSVASEYSFQIDTTPPPSPSIVSGPEGPVSNSSALFAFSSSPGASLECQLGAGWGDCSSGEKNYSSLQDGSYVFSVRAKDAAGNVSAVSSRSFRVDTTPPLAKIARHPARKTRSRLARFRFSSSEEATYLCALDRAALAPCSRNKKVRVGKGPHRMKLVAVDSAGNRSKTAVWRWRVL